MWSGVNGWPATEPLCSPFLPRHLLTLALLRSSRPGVSHCGWPEVTGSPELGIFMRAHPPTGALPVIRKLRIYYRSPPPPPSDSSARCRSTTGSPPSPDHPPLFFFFFLFFDIVHHRSRRGSGSRELFRLLWVEIAMGHPATFQMTGKKAATRASVARENERNWLFELCWLPRNPYRSFPTIVKISHDNGR